VLAAGDWISSQYARDWHQNSDGDDGITADGIAVQFNLNRLTDAGFVRR
jgi:hypothetical protein